jgi:RHS repeat-associated protein
VQERNTYYPSGLQIDALSSTAAGTSDYTEGWANGQRIPAFAAYAGQLHGRRFYDPAVMSWYAVEPLATRYAGVSPYNYALGDPVNLRDATGMEPDGLSYNAHEINSMTYSERRQLGLVWSFTGRGYVAPGVDWTSPFGPAGGPDGEWETQYDVYLNTITFGTAVIGGKMTSKPNFSYYSFSPVQVWVPGRRSASSRQAGTLSNSNGSSAPHYSGSGPLSTSTAMGNCPECPPDAKAAERQKINQFIDEIGQQNDDAIRDGVVEAGFSVMPMGWVGKALGRFSRFLGISSKTAKVGGAAAKVGAAASKVGAAVRAFTVPPEKVAQVASRKWTDATIRQVMDAPYAVGKSINMRNNNPATAYFLTKNQYVVIDDITNEVVQISDLLKADWKVDTRITNILLR